MQLHELPDETTAARLLDMAIEAGINSVDTANVYGRGASEELLGKLLRANGRRERLVLASKVHARMDDDDPNAAGSSRRHIIDQCHASLRRLGVDHLDVYYLHRPTGLVPIDESLRALDDLVRDGRSGTSAPAASQPGRSSSRCGRRGSCTWNGWSPNRPRTPWSIAGSSANCCPWHRATASASRSGPPLAGGLLTGKYRTDNWPPDSRFGSNPSSDWAKHHFTDQSAVVVDAILALAAQKRGETRCQDEMPAGFGPAPR